MKKKGKNAEITVRKCKKVLSLPEQKSRNILNSLPTSIYFDVVFCNSSCKTVENC